MLYRADYAGVSQRDGVSIYPENDVELNCVDICVMYNCDTAGWDGTDYFYFRSEDMENEDGIPYTVSDGYK